MPDTITFQNPGVLDTRALQISGLSVKKTDSPIGYFGTGLKYAVAILVRNGFQLMINAGESLMTFETATDNFRGEDFQAIYMVKDGKRILMPFTTALGREWKLWQAYRELYCNALDEGGQTVFGTLPHGEDQTTIYLGGPQVLSLWEEKDRFFITDAPVLKTSSVDIHAKPGIFCKGVFVGESLYGERPQLGYNIKTYVGLSEDRMLKDGSAVVSQILSALAKEGTYDLLMRVMKSPADTFEYELPWYGLEPSQCSEILKQVVLETYRNNINCPPRVRMLARKLVETDGMYKEINLSPRQELMLKEAREFLEKRGCTPFEFPVKFVDHLGSDTYAVVHDGNIVIAEKAFNSGKKILVHALYEEWIHRKYDLSDESRGMQNFLFEQLLTSWEELEGVVL